MHISNPISANGTHTAAPPLKAQLSLTQQCRLPPVDVRQLQWGSVQLKNRYTVTLFLFTAEAYQSLVKGEKGKIKACACLILNTCCLPKGFRVVLQT